MNTVWILVCDAARGRLFESRDEFAPWALLETLVHEGSRAKAADLVGDQAGRRSSEGGSVHHNALAPASSPKDNEKASFAHSLVKMLDQGVRARRFASWVLIAPPHFVGLIKAELTSELEKHLLTTVAKDLSGLELHALAEHLKDVAHVPANPRAAVGENVRSPR